MATRVKTDELDQWHEYDVYTPARLVSLNGEITEESAVKFIKNIRLLDHVSDKEITVLINTPGGDVHQGMAIIDAIKECHSRVTTHAVGPCWSMGAIIFQAGDFRKISANATVMIHYGSQEYSEDHSLNIERWIAENKRIGEEADLILFNSLKRKNPKLTKKQFEKLLIFDTILEAPKVLELGLADKIEEHKGY
jgi:ATP-dependent Clp protease, protease subunit